MTPSKDVDRVLAILRDDSVVVSTVSADNDARHVYRVLDPSGRTTGEFATLIEICRFVLLTDPPRED